jgi:hypothetical protein
MTGDDVARDDEGALGAVVSVQGIVGASVQGESLRAAGARPDTSFWMTLSQASVVAGMSERTLRRRIEAGEVRAAKIPLPGGGVAWRVDPAQYGVAPAEVARLDGQSRNAPNGAAHAEPVPDGVPTVETAQRPFSPADVPTMPEPGRNVPDTIAGGDIARGELEAVRRELQELRGALVGGALTSISERLARLDHMPDPEAQAAAIQAAVAAGIAQAVEGSRGATADDVAELADLVRAQSAQIEAQRAELVRLSEQVEKPRRRGLFGLFGG